MMILETRLGGGCMEYIIEQIETNGELKFTKSYLVHNNMITYIADRPLRMKRMKLNLSGFKLQPGYVMADFSINSIETEEHLTDRLTRLTEKGCTTMLTTFSINYEREFSNHLKTLRQLLRTSTIDYVIGLSLPVKKLTPSLIRKCQRDKLPFVLVDVYNEDELDEVTWEWIRNANFPYVVQIIPNWKLNLPDKKLNQLQQRWNKLAKEKQIATISPFPAEHLPLQKHQLQQLGIYPQKGVLTIGSELDYVLYREDNEVTSVDEHDNVYYDKKEAPLVVVRKGTIIKHGEDNHYQPGAGQEIVVIRPGLFRTIVDDMI
jgi:hypothetical protein